MTENANKKISKTVLGEKGQVMIITVILFLAFSLTAIFGIINPVIRHAKATRNIMDSKQGYFLSEAGIEDIVYRLKNGLQTQSSNSLSLNGEMVETTVTDNASSKTILSTGNSKDFIRKVEVELILGVGVAFNYGVQTGTGGFTMGNNAGVDGNVYSNGPILGDSGSFITGSAISSNSSALTVDTENSAPLTPPDQIIFGNTNSTQDIGQSFSPTQTGPIGKISLYIKKVSTPSNITVRVVTDNAGNPSTTVLSSAVLPASLITTNFGWVELPMPASVDLLSGSTYWVVLDASTNASRYYILAANSAYAGGQAKIGQHGSIWSDTTPLGLDGYFKIYLGGLTGIIDNVDVGTGGSAIAHAHTVKNSSITGSLYCQTGSGNNKPCDTSQADPGALPLPISEANITQWKSEAESGGVINGDVNLSDNSSTLGPVKIIGNLTVSNNYILTITGTVWVTGNINLSNNVDVRLIPSYGSASGIILSDGRASLSNNVTFQGSGQSGSYIMLLSTSDCPNNATCGGNPAIDISNNAGTVILNAQKGTIGFSNNAGAKEATANLISLANNAVITYESGLINVNFSSGPGGGFDISKWKEIE